MISSLFVRLDNLTKREWVTIPNNKQLCGSAWLIDLMRTISEFISQVSINLIQPLALVGKIIPCVFKINGWWWEEKTSTNEMMLMGSSLKSEKHDGINFKNSKYKMTRFFDKQGYWGYANDKIGVDYVERQQGAYSVNIFCNIMCAWAHFSICTWVGRCQMKRGTT